jgi:hypothetical protein
MNQCPSFTRYLSVVEHNKMIKFGLNLNQILKKILGLPVDSLGSLLGLLDQYTWRFEEFVEEFLCLEYRYVAWSCAAFHWADMRLRGVIYYTLSRYTGDACLENVYGIVFIHVSPWKIAEGGRKITTMENQSLVFRQHSRMPDLGLTSNLDIRG